MTNKEAIEQLLIIKKLGYLTDKDRQALNSAIKALENERLEGEWVGNAFDEHHCNKCGHPALWEEEPDNYYEVQSRFCPNCGADMRKGDEEK